MEKISYSIVRKNPKRKSCKWHGRIRQGGREKLVALNTQDKAEADRWLARQKYLYGEYLAGNVQLSEILTVDSTPVLAQKRASTAVLSLRDCLDGWEQKRRMEAKRETTIATYGRALRIMVDPAMPVTDFGPEQVKAIMASKAGLKPATRRFYSKALLSFCDFLRTEYGCVGLCEALPKVKVDEAPRSYWTPNEMATILLEIESDTAEKTIQYRQYFTLMSQVGSRQGETGKITWADVFDDGHGNGCIRFRGETTKARVGRTVPISFELWAELEDRRGRPDGLVFDAISDCQATRYYVLQKALKKLGLTGNLHKWRHSVSMAMYSKSKDIKACSQLLGHSAAVAMKYYLEARSLEELRELVED